MEVINALGRRKTAVARIYVKAGNGNITINKRDYKEYFPTSILHYVVDKHGLSVFSVEAKTCRELVKALLDGCTGEVCFSEFEVGQICEYRVAEAYKK